MNTSIPIYRAKKISSDEYVEGIVYKDNEEQCFYISADASNLYSKSFKIDETTLAIHIPDGKMIDREGNKIFASLNKDGKGGDIVKYFDYIERYTMLFSSFSGIRAVSFDLKLKSRINAGLKIVGIQE